MSAIGAQTLKSNDCVNRSHLSNIVEHVLASELTPNNLGYVIPLQSSDQLIIYPSGVDELAPGLSGVW